MQKGNIMTKTYCNPIGGDDLRMGDPFVLMHEGVYYLFGTTDGTELKRFRCWRSGDLSVWENIGHTLELTPDSWSTGTFWAPEIVFFRGRFYMSYTATNPGHKGYKVCIAVSNSPDGPYEEYAAPLFDNGIPCWDSHIFIDTDNTPYLFYTSKETSYGIQLREDMKSLEGNPVRCTEIDQAWEMPPSEPKFWCNEGPFVIKHNGLYYMTYSGNHYASSLYAIGYATAHSPLGPWTKNPDNPVVKSDPSVPVSGPGHNSFTVSPDKTELFMVYHTHKNAQPGGERVVNIDRVVFDDSGRMRLTGPTVTPQPVPSGVT